MVNEIYHKVCKKLTTFGYITRYFVYGCEQLSDKDLSNYSKLTKKEIF